MGSQLKIMREKDMAVTTAALYKYLGTTFVVFSVI